MNLAPAEKVDGARIHRVPYLFQLQRYWPLLRSLEGWRDDPGNGAFSRAEGPQAVAQMQRGRGTLPLALFAVT
jgi:hypothetical protein